MALIVGVDLGQQQDYTAVAVIEQRGDPPRAQYTVRNLARWRGEAYPVVEQRLVDLMAMPELREAVLVVDHTGVGRPVCDALRAAGLQLVGVSIHGGDQVTQVGDDYRVPKRDLVASVQVLLQSGWLAIIRSVVQAPLLLGELRNFRVKIDPRTAHDSYSAWREQDHDDMLLAVALACWAGEHRVGGRAHVWFLDGGLREEEREVPLEQWAEALRPHSVNELPQELGRDRW